MNINRIFKFRAWDTLNKKMYFNPFNGKIGGIDDIFSNHGDWEYMQFTGLHDKNSKEIYEGDIVHWNHLVFFSRDKEIREDTYAKIIWGHAGFTFEVIKGNLRTLDMETSEVIGNTYDNPNIDQALRNNDKPKRTDEQDNELKEMWLNEREV